GPDGAPAHRQHDGAAVEEAAARALSQSLPRDGRFLVCGSERAEIVRRVRRDRREEGEALTRRLLPEGDDESRPRGRTGDDRQGCGGTEVHGDRADQGAAFGTYTDSAADVAPG